MIGDGAEAGTEASREKSAAAETAAAGFIRMSSNRERVYFNSGMAIVASPRKKKNPRQSVTVVTKTLEASAGSM